MQAAGLDLRYRMNDVLNALSRNEMELLECAENRQQQEFTKSFLKEFGFHMLPLTQNIGHRATIYVADG